MGMLEDRQEKATAQIKKIVKIVGGSLMMNLNTVKSKKSEKTEE